MFSKKGCSEGTFLMFFFFNFIAKMLKPLFFQKKYYLNYWQFLPLDIFYFQASNRLVSPVLNFCFFLENSYLLLKQPLLIFCFLDDEDFCVDWFFFFLVNCKLKTIVNLSKGSELFFFKFNLLLWHQKQLESFRQLQYFLFLDLLTIVFFFSKTEIIQLEFFFYFFLKKHLQFSNRFLYEKFDKFFFFFFSVLYVNLDKLNLDKFRSLFVFNFFWKSFIFKLKFFFNVVILQNWFVSFFSLLKKELFFFFLQVNNVFYNYLYLFNFITIDTKFENFSFLIKSGFTKKATGHDFGLFFLDLLNFFNNNFIYFRVLIYDKIQKNNFFESLNLFYTKSFFFFPLYFFFLFSIYKEQQSILYRLRNLLKQPRVLIQYFYFIERICAGDFIKHPRLSQSLFFLFVELSRLSQKDSLFFSENIKKREFFIFLIFLNLKNYLFRIVFYSVLKPVQNIFFFTKEQLQKFEICDREKNITFIQKLLFFFIFTKIKAFLLIWFNQILFEELKKHFYLFFFSFFNLKKLKPLLFFGEMQQLYFFFFLPFLFFFFQKVFLYPIYLFFSNKKVLETFIENQIVFFYFFIMNTFFKNVHTLNFSWFIKEFFFFFRPTLNLIFNLPFSLVFSRTVFVELEKKIRFNFFFFEQILDYFILFSIIFRPFNKISFQVSLNRLVFPVCLFSDIVNYFSLFLLVFTFSEKIQKN